MKQVLTTSERCLLTSLSTPPKIQDFLNAFGHNRADTCRSPRRVLRDGKAHCMEGAMLAALAFRVHGEPPLVVDLTAHAKDFDHVIAVFRRHGCWGAVSKTNHPALRYREPVYRTIRELVLSYFHEYFLSRNGEKTLRSYSRPVNLARFDSQNWMTSEKAVWFVPEYLCDVAHVPILTRGQIATLRRADPIEITAGKLREWE